jgi:CRP/FNR family transcriptional regulator, dissimilatory nitrate respiration regulator
MTKPLESHVGNRIMVALQASELLGYLPEIEIREITQFCHWKNLAKEEVLFRRGQKSLGCFIVATGSVSLSRLDANGKESCIGVFRSGGSFAEATLSGSVVYPAEAKAISDSSVILLEKEPFTRYIETHPTLAMRVLENVGKRMRYLVERWEGERTCESHERLAKWIVKNIPSDSTNSPFIQLNGQKKELAFELGMTSETLSRCFTKLKEAGVIALAGKKITILKESELRQISRNQGSKKAPSEN